MSSWHVDSAGTDRLKGHASLFPAEIPPFVFSNKLTITLPRIFRQRYWAILKLWLLNNAAHTGANEQARPIYTLWAHRLTCAHKRRPIHMYDLLKRSSASVRDCCWTGQLLSVQMIMTLPDHLFVVGSMWTPIHYAVSAIAFLSDSCPAL